MNYFLEGIDGSGKSSLANILHNQTGLTIVHRSKPETDEEKQSMYRGYIRDVRSTSGFIWDRCWYSEFVYGAVMRYSITLTYEQMYDLEQIVAKKGGGIIIYCKGNISAIYKKMQRRGEDYITSLDQLKELQYAYDRLFFEMPHYLPVVTLDPLTQKLCPLY